MAESRRTCGAAAASRSSFAAQTQAKYRAAAGEAQLRGSCCRRSCVKATKQLANSLVLDLVEKGTMVDRGTPVFLVFLADTATEAMIPVKPIIITCHTRAPRSACSVTLRRSIVFDALLVLIHTLVFNCHIFPIIPPHLFFIGTIRLFPDCSSTHLGPLPSSPLGRALNTFAECAYTWYEFNINFDIFVVRAPVDFPLNQHTKVFFYAHAIDFFTSNFPDFRSLRYRCNDQVSSSFFFSRHGHADSTIDLYFSSANARCV